MKEPLTSKEKIKVARFAFGILALMVSYVCLVLLPLSAMFGLSVASGAAMTAGGAGHPGFSVFLLPLLIGSAACLFAAIFGPGVIVRLLCIPSGAGYIAAVILLKKIA